MEYYYINGELYHYGTRGMKWGKRLYQHPDGSLTALGRARYSVKKHQAQKKREATIKAKKAAAEEAKKKQETLDEKRAKLLKSANAKELYENRDLLSTSEIVERMDRISKETQLKNLAYADQKTAKDYIDKALSAYKTMDSVYRTVNDSAIGKAIKRELGIGENTDKEFNLEKIMKNANKMSDQEIKNVANRLGDMKKIKEAWDEANKDIKGDVKDAFDLKEAFKNVDSMSDDDIKKVSSRVEARNKIRDAYDKEYGDKSKNESSIGDSKSKSKNDNSNNESKSKKEDSKVEVPKTERSKLLDKDPKDVVKEVNDHVNRLEAPLREEDAGKKYSAEDWARRNRNGEFNYDDYFSNKANTAKVDAGKSYVDELMDELSRRR